MSISAPSTWDVHHHWINEDGYIDRLLRQMDQSGIERVGLIAMGDLVPDIFILHGYNGKAVDYRDLAKLVRRQGDRFWGWGYLRLGDCEACDVDRLKDASLAGLKFHVPWKPYSDPEYFPVYERANALDMPCLFHTGPFYPPAPMPGQGIRSENYRPIHLEPIGHEFPGLRMICAHLGVCWNEEAATLCRMFPNIYADLSGRVDGWRSGKSIEWFKETFFWPDAHRKIVFGTDVHCDEIPAALSDHDRIFTALGWDNPRIANVLRENAVQIMGGT